MPLIPSRFAVLAMASVVTVAAGLSVATIVDAQTPPSGARPNPPLSGGPGPRGGPDGARGMPMMRELDRLKTSLQLNASQAALWDRAIAQMKPPANLREEMKARHDRMMAAVDDPNFDPRRMAAEMDRTGTERKARMSAVRDAWFAVYDSLNPVQRGQAREFLREKMAHGRHRGMREMRGGGMKGGWHRGDEHAAIPPQTPPLAAPPAR